MPNIRSIIAGKNKKLLKSVDGSENNRGCNCNTGTDNCPLKGKCLTKSLIYRAIVKPKNEPNAKNYYGLTSSTFKTRFAQHTSSFRNQNQSRITSLSKYIWKLKEESKEYDVSCEITALAPPYSTEAKHCQLCLTEKTLILFSNNHSTLNQRSEILNKCRHQNKFLLKNHPL